MSVSFWNYFLSLCASGNESLWGNVFFSIIPSFIPGEKKKLLSMQQGSCSSYMHSCVVNVFNSVIVPAHWYTSLCLQESHVCTVWVCHDAAYTVRSSQNVQCSTSVMQTVQWEEAVSFVYLVYTIRTGSAVINCAARVTIQTCWF